jgi:signal transduction histidine kinase
MNYKNIIRELQEVKKNEQQHRLLIERMTHDLSYPLSELHGLCNILTERIETPLFNVAKITERVGSVLYEMERMLNNYRYYGFFVNNIFGYMAKEKEYVNILLILSKIVSRLNYYAKINNKDIKIKANRKEILELLCKSNIELILLNVTHNAVKYSFENYTVEIEVNAKYDITEVNIINYGIGISPEEAKHIYKEGYKGQSSRMYQVEGSGLGLFVAKQLTDRENYILSFHSKKVNDNDKLPLFKTVFTLAIPKAKKE